MSGIIGRKSQAALLLQSFQPLPALMVLQTPVGSLPFQQLADRARDLGTGARPGARLKADFVVQFRSFYS